MSVYKSPRNGRSSLFPRKLWAGISSAFLIISLSSVPRQYSCSTHAQLFERDTPMDSSGEPYSSMTPRTAGPTVTMKTFLSLITVFVIAQLVATVLFGLYLHMKLDKVGEDINLGEDITFLRKLQKCQKLQESGRVSFLDCTKVLRMFQDLQDLNSKEFYVKKIEKGKKSSSYLLFHALPKVPQESSFAMQKGDKRPLAAIHLGSSQGHSKVLQWKKTTYAPADNMFSYRDGNLQVAKSGRYYVYAQVAFCTNPFPSAPFSVYLYLYLPSELDQLLLKGVGTHSGSGDLCGLQSIHLGRVVDLQAGHKLFVNVTDSSRVNYSPGSTYFGMFELP